MFKRLQRFWQLTKKDPKALERLEKLTEEEMSYIPEIGNGKAVFLGEGTEEEFNEQEKRDKGIFGIFGL